MAISSMDQLVAAMTAATAQNIPWNKTAATPEAAGTFFDLSQTAGVPGAMATPDAASSGGTSYTGSAAGGLPFTAPSGSNSLYLASVNATCSVPNSLYIIDRLWACRGLSTTLGATSTVTGMSNITRYSSGVGAEIWYWCITASTFVAGTMTVTYTNSAGVAGRTCTISLAPGSTSPLTTGQCYVGSLQAGDTGVRSVQSVTNTSCSFGGGSHGLFVAKRIITAPMTINSPGTTLDGLRTGLQQIDSNACLNFVQLCSSAVSTGLWAGSVQLIEG
jgi:hypothetical protein